MKKTVVLLMIFSIMSLVWANGPDEDLFTAAMDSNYSLLQESIKNGANPNYADGNFNDRTALMVACSQDWYEGVKYLVEKGRANASYKNSNGQTALMFAARYCQSEDIINYLVKRCAANINAKDNNGRTPLMYAAENKSDRVFSLLLQLGANYNSDDIYGEDALMYSIRNDYIYGVTSILKAPGVVNLEKQNSEGQNAFMLACEKGNLKIAAALIDNTYFNLGMKCNGEPVLIWLIKNRKSRKFIELVINAPDVTASDILSYTDRNGHDARWWAEEKGDEITLQELDEKQKKSKKNKN